MKRSYIIIAIIAAALIAATILARGIVRSALFLPDNDASSVEALQKQLRKAERELAGVERKTTQARQALTKAEEEEAGAREDIAEIKTRISALDGNTPASGEGEDAPENAKLRVEVIKSSAVEIISGIVLSGKAEAASKLDVRAETSGRVISTPLSSGKNIARGDLLCRLDAGTRHSNLTQAQANLTSAQTQYDSARKLFDAGFGTKTSLRAAEATLEQAQTAIAQATRELENLEIRAPIGGVLAAKTAEIGTLLQPGTPCATIISLDSFNLVGFAAESQIKDISLGANVLGILDDGSKLRGRVSNIGSTADPVTRAYRVEINVGAGNGKIRDGSSAKINIALADRPGHLVPQNALTLNSEGELGVKLNIGGQARFHRATLVRDTQEGLWLADLPEEIELIVSGQEYAADGREIEVHYRPASAALPKGGESL